MGGGILDAKGLYYLRRQVFSTQRLKGLLNPLGIFDANKINQKKHINASVDYFVEDKIIKMKIYNKKIRLVLFYWIVILILPVIIFVTNVFEVEFFSINFVQTLFRDNLHEEHPRDGYILNTPGCKIPYMDPFDPNIKKYMKSMSKPKCNNGIPPLFESNLTSVYLLSSSLPKYGIHNISKLQCCYKAFWRTRPRKGRLDNLFLFSKKCHHLKQSADITDEFIKVNCTYDDITTIYVDAFSFVPLKNKTNIRVASKEFNVLVVGLDSVSRLNVHRQMINTLKFLKEQEAVELLGYNKVALNTFPNLMPVLTGLFEDELKNSCWPNVTDRFDKCFFIWNRYKQKEYLTALGEDAASVAIFRFNKYGFDKQPTDYFYTYFNSMSERLNGNCRTKNTLECVGGRLIYKDLLEYVTKFVITMDKNKLPYFGFFWETSFTHDIFDRPKVLDQDLFLFLKELFDTKLLSNTVLILMSDHGLRFGDFRQTFQGMMEDRLPFVFFVLPPSFKETYTTAYYNLKINTKRLTTPFDMHETLVDLVNPSDLLKTENLLNNNQFKRGISLFRTISKNRTCDDASIISHYCTCLQSVEINITSNVIEAAQAAVDNINFQLKGYAQCAKLTLDVVLNARLVSPQFDTPTLISDYLLTMKTSPSEAIFEVTVREKEGSFEVIGGIGRLNLYRNQSSCVNYYHLKQFCYC